MKLGKILFVAMVFWALLLSSTYSVTALEKSDTLEDGKGDVFNGETMDVVTYNKHIDVKNIDIIKLTYEITDANVEFTIEVDGEIDNRGNLDDLSMEGMGDSLNFDIDVASYSFTLSTSDGSYFVSYVNGTCQLSYGLETTNLSNSAFTVNGNALTVSFDLGTSSETFESVTATTGYIKMKFDLSNLVNMTEEELEGVYENFVALSDQVPNEPLYATSNVPNLAETGETVSFNGSAIYGLPPYTYSWEFGDGNTSTEQNPTHIYEKFGKYTYTLTVTDDSGSLESDSGTITISSGDGENGGNGNGSETGQDGSDSGLILFFAVIAIIVVIGIVVLILIIKR